MVDLHRHETASLGLRARRLTGEGREHGRLIRLILLSYTRWPGKPKQDPWMCDATLAARAGLTENEVERAMMRLRAAGIITTRWGKRPNAKPGRLIALELHAPCEALAPDGGDVRNLWSICRSIRARPAALITMMVGAYMLASSAAGGGIEDRAELGCTASALRRFVGQADNSSWTKRLRELEALGLIRREGRRVEVSPPRVWFELAVDVAERARAADRVGHGAPATAANGQRHPVRRSVVPIAEAHARTQTRPDAPVEQTATAIREVLGGHIDDREADLVAQAERDAQAAAGVFLSPPERLARVDRGARLVDAPMERGRQEAPAANAGGQ